MQKTKLGISVGTFGAAIFFSALFGGYLLTMILAGYVLFMEENVWLRKAGVKAVALMMGFSILSSFIGLIPDVMGIIDGIYTMFGGFFSVNLISGIVSAAGYVVNLLEKIVFLMLGFKAFTQGTVQVSVIDNLVNREVK